MPVTLHDTSVFEVGAQTVVNTVNCVGVMGKGLALAMKQRYPAMFDEYLRLCNAGRFKPGNLHLWKLDELPGASWVLNFPTKNHYRNPSKLEWIEAGLEKFTKVYEPMGITSIAFPPLGCSNGQLDWDIVKPLMLDYLNPLPIDIALCTNRQ